MRFLDNNEAVSTSLFSNYALMSLTSEELGKELPKIIDLFQKTAKEYTLKYQFKDKRG